MGLLARAAGGQVLGRGAHGALASDLRLHSPLAASHQEAEPGQGHQVGPGTKATDSRC